MKIIETGIEGLLVVEPTVFGDERGWFQEAFSAPKLKEFGFQDPVVQANHSFSRAGVLRGLHFQRAPHEQSKVVRCLRGRLFDVAVDIRPGSITYGQWFGLELSEDNRKALIVPRGFAHGFYAVTDCELFYLCGHAAYDKDSEGGLRFDDPELSIDWPLSGQPLVNERDRQFPALSELKVCA